MREILKKIHEPSSSISDFILSLFCFFWFYDLWKLFIIHKLNIHFLSSILFFVLAISSILGSFFHMFAKMISNKLIGFNFKIAVFTIGLVLLLISFIYIDILLEHNLKFIVGCLFLFLIIYFYYQYVSKNFNKLIISLLPIILFIILGIYIQLTNNYIGSKETLFGFLIIFLGLIVWKSGFSIHKNFNKNDIFHYISIIGLWFLYQGYKLSIFHK